jgi:hypothetical protein
MAMHRIPLEPANGNERFEFVKNSKSQSMEVRTQETHKKYLSNIDCHSVGKNNDQILHQHEHIKHKI